jgi:AcrR family transcriptional regulator
MLSEQKISRERILEGAAILLDSGRCADLTVDALARSLHMSKSTLYKFFASKEDVLVALVSEACERTEAELEEATSRGGAPSMLTELAQLWGRHGQRLPRAVLVEPELLPTACTARMERTAERFSDAASGVVHRGVESGELRRIDPRMASVAFVAAAEAVLVDAAKEGLPEYGARVGQIPALLLPGLLPGLAP